MRQNSYYPFGLKHKGYNTVVNSTNIALKKMYNGKELEEALDFNMYEMDMRQYDPAIARWTSIDPLAGKAPGWTPYRFGFNNPIRYTDPDGRWEWDAVGNLVAQKGDQSYSLAKFLGTSQNNAMTILNRGGVTANAKGILNLKEGQQFSKSSLMGRI